MHFDLFPTNFYLYFFSLFANFFFFNFLWIYLIFFYRTFGQWRSNFELSPLGSWFFFVAGATPLYLNWNISINYWHLKIRTKNGTRGFCLFIWFLIGAKEVEKIIFNINLHFIFFEEKFQEINCCCLLNYWI